MTARTSVRTLARCLARPRLAWLAAGALWLLVGAGPARASTLTHDIDTARLSRGDLVQQVNLPHVIPGQQTDPRGERLRYTLELTLTEVPDKPLGLFIARASRSAQIVLNGHALGGCAPGALEAARCTQMPLWLQPPPGLWRAGSNRIEVEVYANPMQLNGLSTVRVGPAEALFRNEYQPALLWRQDVVFAMQWALFAVGTLLLLVGLIHRGENRRLYLWFGLACALRGVANFYAQSDPLWGPSLWTQWLFTAARLTSIPVMLLALMAFFEQRLPRVERFLMAYALALPPLTLAAGARADLAVWLALPGMATAIFLMALLAQRAWRDQRASYLLLLGTVGALLAFGLHDAWALATAAGFVRPLALPLINGLLLMVLGGLVMARLVRALATASDLNALLSERVAAAEVDLRRQHQTILALERTQAQAEERERFLRDLHDGLGSHLTSARHLVEDLRLQPIDMRQLLDDCIDDMRLLLDASGPYAQLADAIGNLRYRMTQRLQGAAVQIEWQLALQDVPAVDSQARLQLLRILQEALTNALRHSGGTQIAVYAAFEPSTRQLQLSVTDDGRWVTAAPTRGRGLANMRHRAAHLGAQLEVETRPDGTRVHLLWSVPQDSPPVR